MLRNWYRIVAHADPLVTDLYIYDEIGKSFWGDQTVTAKQFIADLGALPDAVTTLRLHVNSPGGDVFDAVAIANSLRAQHTDKGRTIEVFVEGLAASAATIITSAGDAIHMASNALLMIHDPMGLVMGPPSEMRSMADLLETVRGSIIATYRWVSTLSVEALAEMMAKTTWMNAAEALANGFVTDILEPVTVTATFRPDVLGRLGEIPDAYRPVVAALVATPLADPALAPVPAPPPDVIAADPVEVIRACKIAGVPELAEDLVVAKAPIEQVQARVAAAKEVRGLCLTARLPELAADYIKAGVQAAMVRNQLTALTAKFDSIEIDAHLNPNAVRTVQGTNVFDLYREREAQRLASLKGA